MAFAFGLGGVALAGRRGRDDRPRRPPARRGDHARVTVVPWLAAGAGGATAVTTF